MKTAPRRVPGTGAPAATALSMMSQHRVRRVPVIDSQHRLQGVLAMNDIILASQPPTAPTSADIVDTLKAVCRHRSFEPVLA